MDLDAVVRRAREAGALQREGELRQLVELVHDLHPSTVLEIGTCHGGSLRAWCEVAADDAVIVSIDFLGGEFGGGYTDWKAREIYGYAQRSQQLHLISGDSHSLDARMQALSALAYRPLDFLFIDGDHTYEGVRADFEEYAPMVRDGGLVVLHDTQPDPRDSRNRVHEFWSRNVKYAYPSAYEIRTDGDYIGCGIGVVPWGSQDREFVNSGKDPR